MDNQSLPLILITFYLVHGILIAFSAHFLNKRVTKEDRGIISWICVVSFFIPIAGEILGIITWMISKHVGSNQMLNEYDDYIKFEPLNLEHLRYQAEENMDLLPIGEAIQSDESKDHKDLILRLINSNITNKGKYLNLGLTNNDSETVHYSATTLNVLNNRMEKELEQAKLAFDPAHPATIHHLVQVYERFIDSGLLEENAQKRLEKEYVDVLEREVSTPGEATWLYFNLGKIYKRTSQKDRAIQAFNALIEHFPNEPEGYLQLIEIYYDRRNWSALKSLTWNLYEHVPEEKIPEKQRFIVRHIGGIGV
ncbi:hypothetical protein CEH05_15400 [Halobacillus halophilus]|uniref:Uncharacterized protein n=1 Tax=Halobacillus halophilus (strain ATCC 35676 / DSM 2266 / JCM 20832 / KCTC 3685 / LMG 17431 / NBRC 102448 / NCIMB 2269) TaxID=866895 RepID=I0JQM8_HALH3|nr:tetratricopeptide repeat protein [Halobacillus halophilus]ASF40459.1 hypothetical protein CEH05_15400 [Halobacillus halophilus]CCG46448.1 conserved hypothetical protein [Halobacillus halophilus DSM 2266]